MGDRRTYFLDLDKHALRLAPAENGLKPNYLTGGIASVPVKANATFVRTGKILGCGGDAPDEKFENSKQIQAETSNAPRRCVLRLTIWIFGKAIAEANSRPVVSRFGSHHALARRSKPHTSTIIFAER
jgi:hypothetical protein